MLFEENGSNNFLKKDKRDNRPVHINFFNFRYCLKLVAVSSPFLFPTCAVAAQLDKWPTIQDFFLDNGGCPIPIQDLSPRPKTSLLPN